MTDYPSIDSLKAQAKRLRAAMAERGQAITHATALELVAQQHALRDWNTLSAVAARPNAPPLGRLGLGSPVRGTYLDQPFTGKVVAIRAVGQGLFQLSIHFDSPVDVVTFESFSAFRQRVTAYVDSEGISPARLSNGRPQMQLAF